VRSKVQGPFLKYLRMCTHYTILRIGSGFAMPSAGQGRSRPLTQWPPSALLGVRKTQLRCFR